MADEAEEGPRDPEEDAGNLAAHESFKERHVLMDISNGAVESDAEAMIKARDSTSRDGVQKVDPHRRSKRILGKPTTNQNLDGGNTDDDIFENSCSSSQDEEERLPLRRRSKRLRETYKSEYVNDETSEEKDGLLSSSDDGMVNEETDASLTSSDDDHDNLGMCRRSKRFGRKIGTRTVAGDDEDDSDTVYYQRKIFRCRMSKRLQEKQKANQVSEEGRIETSSMLSGSSSSDNGLLHYSVKANSGASGGPICSLCKSGTARSHFTQCLNSSCSSSFHTFCQNPPLQDGIQTSECSLCKINQRTSANLTEELMVKKIDKIVGHRMVTIKECSQYEFLIKWHSLSHHHDCWVPLEWLQVFDRLRVQSFLNKNTLLKEDYLEDQRKPEWSEVDRAIACRRKSVPTATFDILTISEDNKDFDDYEFLVKWKGLDYSEATWEPYCTGALIPGSRFLVDAFRHAGDFSVAYFLSHFHCDHYTGLGSSWRRGLIFCSAPTARLLTSVLSVPPELVVALDVGVRVTVDGWGVTAVNANHCPGAVQFLFASPEPNTERYVHTGDFRYTESMTRDPNLLEFVRADAVFLDTTYCNPKFTFPPQEESVDYIVNAVKRVKEESAASGERVLFLIATYVVGKERILLEVANRCECLIHVDRRKMDILTVLGFDGEEGVFTEDTAATDVHVIGWNLLGETWPYFRPNFVKMKEIMLEKGYKRAVGFVPTGWMYETKKEGFAVRVKDSLEIHLVPYSEHSSYDELRDYIKFLHPKRVIPTVGVNSGKLDSKEVIAMQKHFAGLVDETANKQDFLMAFNRRSTYPAQGCEDMVAKDSSQHDDDDALLPVTCSASGQSGSLGEKVTEETKKELSDFLPSWVSQEQIMDLLMSSGGDVVKAASDFFERERDLFEEANVSCSETPKSEKSRSSDNGSSADASSQQECPLFSQKPVEYSTKLINLTPVRMNPNILKKGRKMGSSTANKPRKKGKLTSSTESGGRKQSTITKFFIRATTAASNSDTADIVTAEAQQNNGENDDKLSDIAKTCNQNVDQLLQIVNGGMSKEYAVSLLEKAKGDVSVAVDIFYSASQDNSVIDTDKNIMLQSTQNEMIGKCSNPGMSCDSSQATPKMPNLYVQTSLAQADSINVSLPTENYLPIEHACWTAGHPAPYLHLARTFDLVEREKGKIKTTRILCNMLRSLLALSPDDVLPAVYLCTNKISPDHENMELNIGGSLVITALEESLGTSRSKLHEMYKTYGDLGTVAQECRQNQTLLAPPRPLSIRDVYSMLRKLSAISGSGSAGRRKILVLHLIRSCREMEVKFIVRTLVRNLRIGAMMKTILPALAHAVVLDRKHTLDPMVSLESLKPQLQSLSTEVAEAYNVIPNLDLLIPSLLREGPAFSATSLAMVPGTPIPPMLARITNGLAQSLKLFHGRAFTCEYKYDGQRAQIHKLVDGSVRIFSRQMKESTARFPDLVNIIKEMCSHEVSSFILDAEVVGIDRKKGNKLMSFQELSSRERGNKHSSIAIENIKVDICVFIFDIMFCNGQRLLDCPLRQRRKHMHDLFQEKPGYFELAQQLTVEANEASADDSRTLDKMNSFFTKACQSSCEGIMLKTLDVDAGYSASKRCDSWLKVKRDYVEGLGDSLDLVPIGAWYGNGRKAGWYSPFLMACYNPETEEFQSVCRVMSGFTDEFYKEMKEFYSGERILPKKPVYYKTDEQPELWFTAEQVWEIRGADLTLSPVHHAAIGLVHPSRGISVRMPRYIRSVPDRNPEDCSTATDVATMFQAQTRKMEVSSEGQK